MSKSTIDVININTPTTGKPKVISFNTSAMVDCFCSYIFGKSRDAALSTQIQDSSGQTFPEYKDKALYNNTISEKNSAFDNGVIGYSLPIVSQGYPTIGGSWKGEVNYDPDYGIPEMKVTQRITQEGQFKKYVLPVNLVLYCAKKNLDKRTEWINKELNKVKSIFQQASINCVFSSIHVKGSPPKNISDDFWSKTTGDVVKANAKNDQLTVIIIENLIVKLPLEAGKSGGIPGPQGFVNNFAAVLIRITNDPADVLVTNQDFLAYTIAHEMGHYLGLTHDSAANDNTNLMYYKLSGLTTGSLNATQFYILQNMPLVQMDFDSKTKKTPITQLEVIVVTGTRWPTWSQGPGTDMNVSFTLGSEDNGYQTWELNSWGNDFESGTSSQFTLTGVKNLFLEDINTWKIACSWSADMWIPFLGGPDNWNFMHLTLKVNGVLTDDREVDVFLSYQTGYNTYTAKFK